MEDGPPLAAKRTAEMAANPERIGSSVNLLTLPFSMCGKGPGLAGRRRNLEPTFCSRRRLENERTPANPVLLSYAFGRQRPAGPRDQADRHPHGPPHLRPPRARPRRRAPAARRVAARRPRTLPPRHGTG